jgi:hypothetical protein
MRYSILTLIGYLLVTFLSLPQSSATTASQETQLGGLNITMSLVKRTDRTPQAWPAEPVQLLAEPAQVKDGDTIQSLLRANGILPDVEAFAVVYALNSEMQNLSPLAPSTQLRLPKAQGGAGLQAALQQDSLVALTVDQKLKRDFDENVINLMGPMVPGPSPGVKRFPRAARLAANDPTLRSLQKIGGSLEFMRLALLRRNGPPMASEALSQLNAQADLLYSLLRTRGELSAADRDLIKAIEEDIEIKKSAFTQVAAGEPPARWNQVKVTVKTLKQGQEASGLRVYYVPKALKGNANHTRPFNKMTSPAEHLLQEGSFYIWAARDPEMAPVTNEHPLVVRKLAEDVILVELTVIR